jgi:SNF2 family DNA or RNA helicase
MKEDVDKTIPLKEETIVEVELTSTQKKYYRAILDKNREFLYRGAKSNANLPQLVRSLSLPPFRLLVASKKID